MYRGDGVLGRLSLFILVGCLVSSASTLSLVTYGSAAEASLSTVEHKRETNVGLYTAALAGIGGVAYASCSAPYSVPTAVTCVASGFAVIIAGLAGVWRALFRRNVEGGRTFYDTFGEHFQPGGRLVDVAPHRMWLSVERGDSAHVMTRHHDDGTKHHLYFEHTTEGLSALHALHDIAGSHIPQRRWDGKEQSNKGGVYLSYWWNNVDKGEEFNIGYTEGRMRSDAQDAFNSGQMSRQGTYCCNWFVYDQGNADQGLLAIENDYPPYANGLGVQSMLDGC